VQVEEPEMKRGKVVAFKRESHLTTEGSQEGRIWSSFKRYIHTTWYPEYQKGVEFGGGQERPSTTGKSQKMGGEVFTGKEFLIKNVRRVGKSGKTTHGVQELDISEGMSRGVKRFTEHPVWRYDDGKALKWPKDE